MFSTRPTILSLTYTFLISAVIAMSGCAGNFGENPFAFHETPPLETKHWTNTQKSEFFSMPVRADMRLHKLQISNALGVVHVEPSDTGKVYVEVRPVGGFAPRFLAFEAYEGWQHLFVLDEEDIRHDPKPEPPRFLHDGTIRRLLTKLPRVDVYVKVPKGTILDVIACAKLEVNASASIIARCGSEARVNSGEGELNVSIVEGKLQVTDASYALTADVNGRVNFHSAVGNKTVRGDCDVVISGGEGFVDIDVSGDVFAETSISAGHARSSVVGQTPSTGGLSPIGPTQPMVRPRRGVSDNKLIANRIYANEVELRLPRNSALEVIVATSDGHVEVDLPKNQKITTQELSHASARFSINHAYSELRVQAVKRAEIIVMQK